MGNARVNFRANGAAVTFLQELYYYPFGMLMEGIGTAKVTENGYKYNGKELNEDLGLNWYDYGARWYDASLGKWWSVDPMGEKAVNHSGYVYVLNNPMLLIDPNGMLAGNPFDVMAERKNKQAERNAERDNQIVEEDNQSTVHILALEGADTKAIKASKGTLDKCAKAAELSVIFKIYDDPNDFNITRMPLTDAVAVVGKTKSQAADYILNNFDKGYLGAIYRGALQPNSQFRTLSAGEYPEVSDAGDNKNWGYFIATSTSDQAGVFPGLNYSSAHGGFGLNSLPELIATNIFHGMGHVSGISHGGGGTAGDNGYMANADRLADLIRSQGGIIPLITYTNRTYKDIATATKKRFNRN